MKYTRVLLFACLLLALGCQEESKTPSGKLPEASSEPTYALRFNLENDESWVVKGQRVETTTENPGTPEESVETMKTVITRKYNSKGLDKENTQRLTMTYTHVYVEYTGPKGDWKYDSNVPSDLKDAWGFEHLAGTSMDLRLDGNTGQVIGVQGGDDYLERVAGDTNVAKIGNQLMMERAMPEFYIFPDGAVPVGGTWQRTGTFSSLYHVRYTHDFTLESRDGNTAVIKLDGKISPLPVEEAFPDAGPDGNPVVNELSGTNTETITVDEPSGKVSLRSSKTQLEGHRLSIGPEGTELSRTPVKIDIQRDSEISFK